LRSNVNLREFSRFFDFFALKSEMVFVLKGLSTKKFSANELFSGTFFLELIFK